MYCPQRELVNDRHRPRDRRSIASTVVDTALAPGIAKTRARAVTSSCLEPPHCSCSSPFALYFWFIHRYGVNAIYYDQWNDVALLTHTRYISTSILHTTVGALWAQHDENRPFFPNLVVLALGAVTNLNTVTEMYLSAVLLVISLVLIILAHRQDVGPRTPCLLPSRRVLGLHPRPV